MYLQAKFSLAVQTITLKTQDFSWSSGFPWYPTLLASVSFRFSPHVPQMAVTTLTLSLPLHTIQGKSEFPLAFHSEKKQCFFFLEVLESIALALIGSLAQP